MMMIVEEMVNRCLSSSRSALIKHDYYQPISKQQRPFKERNECRVREGSTYFHVLSHIAKSLEVSSLFNRLSDLL